MVTIIVGLQIFRADIDPDMEKYIPQKMSSRINTTKIEEIFGGDELLLAVFEADDILQPASLSRIKAIRKEINKLDEVDQVLSVFDAKNISSEDGYLLVEPFVKGIPKTEESIEKLRNDLLNSEMARNVVISEDFRLSAIIMSLNSEAIDDTIVAKVKHVIENNPGEEKVYLGGLPYLKNTIALEIASDLKKLMIVGLIIMLIMLYLFFREIRGVILPFMVVVMAIIFSMGLIPLLGWKLSIITLLLPIMMIAIANDYGIHLMARYQELNWSDSSLSNGSLAKNVFTSLKTPILLTGLTTVAGILCLLSHKMFPAKQLGVVAAIGITFALLLSLLLIPSVLSFINKSRVRRFYKNGNRPFLDKILEKTGLLVISHPGKIVVAACLIALVAGGGAFMVHVDTDVINFFPEKHPVRKSSDIINKTFGGSQNIAVHIEGDLLDPELMQRIDTYTQMIDGLQEVGFVVSVSNVVREISKAMNDPADDLYDTIPFTREAIAQYLELYSMSANPEDLEKLIDFNYENAQILIRINNGSNNTIKSVLQDVHRITKDDPNIMRIGGYGLVVAEMAELVVRGQILSLIFAIIIIILIISILFRSYSAGIITAMPLAFALVILFGLMGYFRISLDMATAILSSIMIGVGVDYTIHFLWRYREERKIQNRTAKEAVIHTLTTTGRGITFNALSVIIGFSVLLFSSFAPIRFFGYLVIISIAACMVGALVIIPSLVLLLRPRFAEGKTRKKPLRVYWRFYFPKKISI